MPNTTIHIKPGPIAGIYAAELSCGSCRLRARLVVSECSRAELPELVRRLHGSIEILREQCAPCHGEPGGVIYSAELVREVFDHA